MITENDLQEAIAECQGKRNPDAKTCMMLAAFLTIKREMYPDHSADPGRMVEPAPAYSFAPPPDGLIDYKSGSAFAARIDGRQAAEIWPIFEELVEAVHLVNPRLYRSFMDKLG